MGAEAPGQSWLTQVVGASPEGQTEPPQWQEESSRSWGVEQACGERGDLRLCAGDGGQVLDASRSRTLPGCPPVSVGGRGDGGGAPDLGQTWGCIVGAPAAQMWTSLASGSPGLRGGSWALSHCSEVQG